MSQLNARTDEWPEAVYTEQVNPDYQGNPYIEALPPIVEDDGAIEGMQNLIYVTAAEREFSATHRMHMLARIEKFMQPLDYHIGLFHRVSVLLRQGYVSRNPSSIRFMRELSEASAELSKLVKEIGSLSQGRVKAGTRQRIGPGSGFTLLGTSGVGKTTAVEAVLRCYDQVICHSDIKGPLAAVYQLVWLKLSIPPVGSIKALCMDFFEAIDELIGTNYFRLYVTSNVTVDKLIIVMGRIAFLHGLGMLVIDELQNLSVAKSGGAEQMMNTFKLLRDVVKVPLVIIGTPEAVAILSSDFQTARRSSGLEPMERMKDDQEFRLFCTSLFDAQFLRSPIELTDDIVSNLHWLSQGIADVVVKVFMSAQNTSLSAGSESMEAEMFETAYHQDLKLLHPFLDDIRRGNSVEGPLFDAALSATKLASRQAAAASKLAVASTVAVVMDASSIVAGVKERRQRRKKGNPSTCLLVRVVDEAVAKQISPHQALFAEGFIRALGAEVLAQ